MVLLPTYNLSIPLVQNTNTSGKDIFNLTNSDTFFPPPPPPSFLKSGSFDLHFFSFDVIFIDTPFVPSIHRIMEFFQRSIRKIVNNSYIKSTEKPSIDAYTIIKQFNPKKILPIRMNVFPLVVQDACSAARDNNIALLEQCRIAGVDLNALTTADFLIDLERNFVVQRAENFMHQTMADHLRPIHSAAYFGNLEAFQYLIDQGVDLSARTVGQSPWTDVLSQLSSIRFLVYSAASSIRAMISLDPSAATLDPTAWIPDVIYYFRPENFTCAHLAAQGDRLNILEKLYELNEIDLLRSRDYYGRTIAHYGNSAIYDWINSKPELRDMLGEYDNSYHLPIRGHAIRVPYRRGRDGTLDLPDGEERQNPWTSVEYEPAP